VGKSKLVAACREVEAEELKLTMSTVDAEIVRDADRFKMDLVGGLERTLHGQVKPSMFNYPSS
jgi:hypothetical protein